MTKLPKLALLALIRLYRLVFSAIIGRNCRFQPSCSAYALEAIEKYGTMKGGGLTIKRLCACHPVKMLGGRSGYDPVP